jgi:uncharacterized protein YutE (UPF0331/DUF86 family)
MRLDVYQAETLQVVAEQGALLDTARSLMAQGRVLSPLEQAGVLRALQVLIENAIGKAKHLLKAKDVAVPVSGYDAFANLVRQQLIDAADLPQWNAAVGLRNRIVHDYMNIDMEQVLALVANKHDAFVREFLLKQFKL